MTRANRHLLIALLLPVLVFRALLPAGFMPVSDGAGLRLVMCSDGLAALSSHAHEEAPASGGQDPQDRDEGACLFALSATGAPPVEFLAARSEPLYFATFAPAQGVALPPASGPPRQASVRGPPHSA